MTLSVEERKSQDCLRRVQQFIDAFVWDWTEIMGLSTDSIPLAVQKVILAFSNEKASLSEPGASAELFDEYKMYGYVKSLEQAVDKYNISHNCMVLSKKQAQVELDKYKARGANPSELKKVQKKIEEAYRERYQVNLAQSEVFYSAHQKTEQEVALRAAIEQGEKPSVENWHAVQFAHVELDQEKKQEIFEKATHQVPHVDITVPMMGEWMKFLLENRSGNPEFVNNPKIFSKKINPKWQQYYINQVEAWLLKVVEAATETQTLLSTYGVTVDLDAEPAVQFSFATADNCTALCHSLMAAIPDDLRESLNMGRHLDQGTTTKRLVGMVNTNAYLCQREQQTSDGEVVKLAQIRSGLVAAEAVVKDEKTRAEAVFDVIMCQFVQGVKILHRDRGGEPLTGFNFLLQNLMNFGWEPPGKGAETKAAMLDAMNMMQTALTFTTPADLEAFKVRYGLEAEVGDTFTATAGFIVHPVTENVLQDGIKGVGGVMAANHVKERTSELFSQFQENMPEAGSAHRSAYERMASDYVTYAARKDTLKRPGVQMIQAAMEAFLINQGRVPGILSSSCKSGKDRRFQTLVVNTALTNLYLTDPNFSMAAVMNDPSVRAQFNREVARQFVELQGELIAELNAPGAPGIKKLNANFSHKDAPEIRKEIDRYARELDIIGQDESYFDYVDSISANNKPADINPDSRLERTMAVVKGKRAENTGERQKALAAADVVHDRVARTLVQSTMTNPEAPKRPASTSAVAGVERPIVPARPASAPAGLSTGKPIERPKRPDSPPRMPPTRRSPRPPPPSRKPPKHSGNLDVGSPQVTASDQSTIGPPKSQKPTETDKVAVPARPARIPKESITTVADDTAAPKGVGEAFQAPPARQKKPVPAPRSDRPKRDGAPKRSGKSPPT